MSKLKKLLGENIMVIPDNSDERVTPGGIIIPKTVKDENSELKSGVVVRKGTGAPWNRMDEIHLKDRVYFHKGAGKQHKELADDGREVEYLILKFTEVLFG